jgi:hypothetical protein
MQATPVAQAGPQAGQLSAEKWIARTRASLELFRLDGILGELLGMAPLRSEVMNRARERLIEWYRSRRAVLAQELGL